MIDLFFDCVPLHTPVEQIPCAAELKALDCEIALWDLQSPSDRLKVFWNLGPRTYDFDFASLPKEKMVLVTWEPPTVQPELHDPKIHAHFSTVFTWNDDLVDNQKYFKFFYPCLRPRIASIPPFEEKKFCTLIATRLSSKHPHQLYSEREQTIRFFEDKVGEFDLYGKGWEKRKFKNWKGPIGDKMAVLKDYKFCICYENTRDIKGYITEKIFDCFAAGVVPIYWGASNVTEYIPAACFIDRRKFKNTKELYRFLKKINKEAYEAYLKEAAQFLDSPAAKRFTGINFAENFVQRVTTQNPSS